MEQHSPGAHPLVLHGTTLAWQTATIYYHIQILRVTIAYPLKRSVHAQILLNITEANKFWNTITPYTTVLGRRRMPLYAQLCTFGFVLFETIKRGHNN